MQSIVDCTFNKDKLSVYVCDGISQDNSVEIVKQYSAKYSFIFLLENPKRTTPYALNIGITASIADVIMILGAHAEIFPDYIEQSLELLKLHQDVGCVGGILENKFFDETSESIALAMSSPFGVGNSSFRTGGEEGYVDTVAFGSYRRDVFDKCGLFDEELARNQDDEFNFRILKKGFKIYFSPKIRSKYHVRSGFEKLMKQYYQYGFWKVYVNKKHAVITTIRQLVPPIFVLSVILGLLFSTVSVLFSLVTSASFLIYLSAALVFAFMKVPAFRYLPKVILSFFILHFSYGSGYLYGLIHFIGLNKKPEKSHESLTR